ncbi:MAG: hypothetical protein ACOZQL_10755 [Myxococcota bacterium]
MRRVKMPTKKPAKHHNSALAPKVAMRRWLVEQLGGIEKVRVLDCFAAKGMLWERAYDRTPNYLGLDIRQFDDERRMVVTDSRRFLRHQDVDVRAWNLFDLDAFGTPLEHLALLCERWRQVGGGREPIGICLTDGTGFNANMNSTSRGLLRYVGMAQHRGATVQADYRSAIFNAAVAKALDAARFRIVASKSATQQNAGNEMVYVALHLEPVPVN